MDALDLMHRRKKCPKGSRRDTRKGHKGNCRKVTKSGRWKKK